MGLIRNRDGICRSYQQQVIYLTHKWEELYDRLAYTLPQATEAELGGVKAPAKGADQTEAVGIDVDGTLYTKPIVEPTPYELPQATEAELGGVKAVAKTATQTKAVAIDTDGKLWSEDTTGGSSYTLPMATENELGGVKAPPRSSNQVDVVGINTDGKLLTGYITSLNTSSGLTHTYNLYTITKTGISGNLTENEKKYFVNLSNPSILMQRKIVVFIADDRLYYYITKRDIGTGGATEWEYVFASVYPNQPEDNKVNVGIVVANPAAATWAKSDIILANGGGGGSYTLPQATAGQLGGVKVSPLASWQKEDVGITGEGLLKTRPITTIFLNGQPAKDYDIKTIEKSGGSGSISSTEWATLNNYTGKESEVKFLVDGKLYHFMSKTGNKMNFCSILKGTPSTNKVTISTIEVDLDANAWTKTNILLN